MKVIKGLALLCLLMLTGCQSEEETRQFLLACKYDAPATIEAMLNNGIDVDGQDKTGLSGLMVAAAENRHEDVYKRQGLRFREQRREMRVKLAVVGEQRLGRGVASQQAVALDGGCQRRQGVELFGAEQLAADFDAVRAGVGDKRQDGGLAA